MGLAVIPDDWEDQYIELCLRWPNSPDWRAILRGLLVAPYDVGFWDKFTGDPSDALAAIEPTFNTNLHLEECMVIPVGTVLEYAGLTEPDGYLFCLGQAISRTTYAALFAVIGTVFGVGNGTTTFNLPDRRGKVGIGWSDTDPDFNDVGNVGGSKTHTLTTAQLPSHNHVQDAHNHTQNSHNHTQNSHIHAVGVPNNVVAGGVSTYSAMPYQGWNSAAQTTPKYNSDATTPTNVATTPTNVATTPTNQATGGGTAHNNLQPYITQIYIIKF